MAWTKEDLVEFLDSITEYNPPPLRRRIYDCWKAGIWTEEFTDRICEILHLHPVTGDDPFPS